MALLTRTDLSIAGSVPSYVAVSSSDTFPVDQYTFIHVKNGGGSSDTVAIDSLIACSQGVDHDGGSAVANGSEKMFSGFNPSRFANASGVATITHSFTTSVTCAVFRVPPATQV